MRLEFPFLLVILSWYYGSELTVIANDHQLRGHHANLDGLPRCSALVEEHYKGGPTVGLLWDLLAKCSDPKDDMDYNTAQSLLTQNTESEAARPTGENHVSGNMNHHTDQAKSSPSAETTTATAVEITEEIHEAVGTPYDVYDISLPPRATTPALSATRAWQGGQDSTESTVLFESSQASPKSALCTKDGRDSTESRILFGSSQTFPESALGTKPPETFPSRQEPPPAQTKSSVQSDKKGNTLGVVRSKEEDRGRPRSVEPTNEEVGHAHRERDGRRGGRVTEAMTWLRDQTGWRNTKQVPWYCLAIGVGLSGYLLAIGLSVVVGILVVTLTAVLNELGRTFRIFRRHFGLVISGLAKVGRFLGKIYTELTEEVPMPQPNLHSRRVTVEEVDPISQVDREGPTISSLSPEDQALVLHFRRSAGYRRIILRYSQRQRSHSLTLEDEALVHHFRRSEGYRRSILRYAQPQRLRSLTLTDPSSECAHPCLDPWPVGHPDGVPSRGAEVGARDASLDSCNLEMEGKSRPQGPMRDCIDGAGVREQSEWESLGEATVTLIEDAERAAKDLSEWLRHQAYGSSHETKGDEDVGSVGTSACMSPDDKDIFGFGSNIGPTTISIGNGGQNDHGDAWSSYLLWVTGPGPPRHKHLPKDAGPGPPRDNYSRDATGPGSPSVWNDYLLWVTGPGPPWHKHLPKVTGPGPPRDSYSRDATGPGSPGHSLLKGISDWEYDGHDLHGDDASWSNYFLGVTGPGPPGCKHGSNVTGPGPPGNTYSRDATVPGSLGHGFFGGTSDCADPVGATHHGVGVKGATGPGPPWSNCLLYLLGVTGPGPPGCKHVSNVTGPGPPRNIYSRDATVPGSPWHGFFGGTSDCADPVGVTHYGVGAKGVTGPGPLWSNCLLGITGPGPP